MLGYRRAVIATFIDKVAGEIYRDIARAKLYNRYKVQAENKVDKESKSRADKDNENNKEDKSKEYSNI